MKNRSIAGFWRIAFCYACIYIHFGNNALWITPVDNKPEKSSYFFDLTAYARFTRHILAGEE